MARITPIHWRKLLKIFEMEGCILVGQTGDHLELKKAGAKRRIVIPKYKLPEFLEKYILSCCKKFKLVYCT